EPALQARVPAVQSKRLLFRAASSLPLIQFPLYLLKRLRSALAWGCFYDIAVFRADHGSGAGDFDLYLAAFAGLAAVFGVIADGVLPPQLFGDAFERFLEVCDRRGLKH